MLLVNLSQKTKRTKTLALTFHISYLFYLFRLKHREGYSPFNVCLFKYTEDTPKIIQTL